MDGRRECEEIRDSRDISDFYSYIYIYICLSNLLIYPTKYRTLYHSALSKNLIVFSTFDCL